VELLGRAHSPAYIAYVDSLSRRQSDSGSNSGAVTGTGTKMIVVAAVVMVVVVTLVVVEFILNSYLPLMW
jgi:hypothetical protein